MSEQINKTNSPAYLASEDVVILKREHEVMYQQCGECKLTHRIEVSPRTEDLRFKFVNVGHEFPDDFTIENHVIRRKPETERGVTMSTDTPNPALQLAREIYERYGDSDTHRAGMDEEAVAGIAALIRPALDAKYAAGLEDAAKAIHDEQIRWHAVSPDHPAKRSEIA